jgi:prepilin-type N-terminal cleavage/methylation domain-containing protein
VKRRGSFTHPVRAARRATRRRLTGGDESGFTLIELLITITILPIVVGGIAVALISVISLQGSVSNRIGNSNDALVASASFNRDVQSAEQMTTQSTPDCGTSTQTQILGLRWGANTAAAGGYETVVSYISTPVVNPQTGSTTYKLSRQVCTSGASTTPTTTFTVAHNIGSPNLVITGANNANVTSSFATWYTAQGVTGVTFNLSEPGGINGNYNYSLVGLPGESTSQSSASSLTVPATPGCGFAATGSGTYANQLCFADFAGVTNPPLHSSGQCQSVARPIANTPYTLQFCVSVSGNNVKPAAIPTYYNPSGYDSEAFLGNNGFYTGIPGDPALYQYVNGALTTVWFTNIQVLDAAGHPATGWTLVTGDAESTDANEWMVFQSNLNWAVLPNNGASDLWGNACYNTNFAGNNGALAYNGIMPPTDASVALPANNAALSVAPTTFATGVSTIDCQSSIQLNKTGTMMLQAQEPTGTSAAQTLTVSMQGAGFQALFLGVLL